MTLDSLTACVPRDNAQRTDGSLQRALGRSQGNTHHTLVKVDHQHLDNVILALDVVAVGGG